LWGAFGEKGGDTLKTMQTERHNKQNWRTCQQGQMVNEKNKKLGENLEQR